MSTGFGTIMQHGYIVTDAEKSAAEWAERVGAGPFYMGDQRMEQYYYRGVRMDIELRLAFGYWGAIQIELIQPLGRADSLYSRALQTSSGKLNHLATVVSDLDGLLSSRQLHNRVIQNGSTPSGLTYAYLDEYVPGGLHLELIQAQPSTLMAFASMEKAARQWNGQNPVRPMSALAQDVSRT